SGYASNHFFFYQPELENILREGCERFAAVDTLYDTEIQELAQDEDGVTVISEGNPIATASYLIACDGAHSFTRQALGIGVKDLGFRKKVLKVDAFDTSDENPTVDTVHKFCSTQTPWVRMQGVGKHRRWELNFDRGLSREEMEDVKVAHQLLGELGIDTSELDIQHMVQYQFRSVLAKTWHRGKVFIAGDAAHTTPPYIGQGMGAGFRDIMNLSWKIDAVLTGNAPRSLFASYQAERYPHAKQDIQKAIAVGWLFTTRLWVVLSFLARIPWLNQRLQNLKVSRGKVGKGFFGGGKAARKLFPQIRLGEGQFSDTLLGYQWALVAIGASAEQELENLSERYQLRYLQVDETLDDYPILAKWAKRQKAQYLIVRPDLYVFSSGNDPAKLCQEYRFLREEQ
ncbi:MAG: FAD-dependent monooxygenase, partial [Bacteroidota bacterium]